MFSDFLPHSLLEAFAAGDEMKSTMNLNRIFNLVESILGNLSAQLNKKIYYQCLDAFRHFNVEILHIKKWSQCFFKRWQVENDWFKLSQLIVL